MEDKWVIRDAIPQDLPFIYATWSKTIRYDTPLGKSCQNEVFFKEYYKVIDHILMQEKTKVKIAGSIQGNDVIYGFMVHEYNILHFAYTKEAFWRFGIAKSLLEQLGGARYITHKTNSIKPILECHKEFIYNPFLLFKQQKELDNGKAYKDIS